MMDDELPRNIFDQPSEVIQRWYRIKMLSIGRALGRRLIRPKIQFQERRRRKHLVSAFESVKNLSIKLEHSDFEASKVIVNVGLYLLIAELDIQAVKVDALTHPDRWKRNLAIRTIALTIHEWDMDKVAGRRLKDAMTEAGIDSALQLEVVDALRSIRKVQSKCRRMFALTRNSTIAHREGNALFQYRTIRNLNSETVLSLAAEFYESAEQFQRVLPKIILVSSNLDGLLTQMGGNNA